MKYYNNKYIIKIFLKKKKILLRNLNIRILKLKKKFNYK